MSSEDTDLKSKVGRRWWAVKLSASAATALTLSLSALGFSITEGWETFRDQDLQTRAYKEAIETSKLAGNRGYQITISNNTITYSQEPRNPRSEDCSAGWGDIDNRIADLEYVGSIQSSDAKFLMSSFSNPSYFQVEGTEILDGTVVTLGRYEIGDFSGIRMIADTPKSDPIVEFLQDTDEVFEAVSGLLSRYC